MFTSYSHGNKRFSFLNKGITTVKVMYIFYFYEQKVPRERGEIIKKIMESKIIINKSGINTHFIAIFEGI